MNVQIQKEKHQPTCCIGLWHLIAGFLMVILGVYVWTYPILSVLALSLYIGVALIVIGAGYVGSSLRTESGWFMFVGLIDILVGIILVSNLGVTAVTLPAIFALWCIAVGAAQSISAYRFLKTDQPWGWSASLGLLGLLFGFIILAYPQLGAVAIGTLLGLYIVLYGILEIFEYFYFRKLARQIESADRS